MIFSIVEHQGLALVPQGTSVMAAQQNKTRAAKVGADGVPSDAAPLRRSQRFIKDRDLIVQRCQMAAS